MVAAEEPIRSDALREEVSVCLECLGAGTVFRSSEIAYFEERRACSRCELGRRIDSKIADIVSETRAKI